ncbi:unnamed protein product [Adineta ricciae]|uniref:Uncharacterized protein n=1 Tax=Adineta ricciae TaxID=249248 RepID=A0A815VMY0_ADIRI|nr:unnamed protein product [Adineta ricciae]CAF1674073.1 unnamed protein product [Adineta ricciae]
MKERIKVRGIFTQSEAICKTLKIIMFPFNANLIPLSIVAITSTTNLGELDPSFMHSQLLKEILLDISHGDETKQAFVDFCRIQYCGDSKQEEAIDLFEEYYSHPIPIH